MVQCLIQVGQIPLLSPERPNFMADCIEAGKYLTGTYHYGEALSMISSGIWLT